MRSRKVQLNVLAVLGVLLSMFLVLLGFPEATAAQKLMLELSALPIAVSLAAGDLLLLDRAVRQPSPAARRALQISAIVSGVGLLLMIVSLAASVSAFTLFGQFLVFIGLLVVLLIALGLQQRPRAALLRMDQWVDDDPHSPPSAE